MNGDITPGHTRHYNKNNSTGASPAVPLPRQFLSIQRLSAQARKLSAATHYRRWSQQGKRFDPDSDKVLAVEVSEYFIPDFTDWKAHDAFEAAFKKLLEDLRAAERKDKI